MLYLDPRSTIHHRQRPQPRIHDKLQLVLTKNLTTVIETDRFRARADGSNLL